MAEALYAGRDAVMRAPDIRASAYATADIDAALASASVMVDKLCHVGARDRGIPGFLPWTGTLQFDWPNAQDAGSYRLWLDNFRLASLTALTSGGVNVLPSALLEPAAGGPPYTHIDLDRAGGAAWSYGSGTGQRSISATGTWCAVQPLAVTHAGFTLSTSPNASTTTIGVNSRADVGDVLLIDTERMLVTEKSWVFTGQTPTLAAAQNAVSVTVADGSVFRPGEELLIDAERLLVVDIAGNTLVVRRAFGGSTLAAHTASNLYWPRSLTVERGALGTVAAAHSSGASIFRQAVPGPIRSLTIAYALDEFFQQGAGYARTIGSNEGERSYNGRAIKDLEERVYGAYGRRYRMRAV